MKSSIEHSMQSADCQRLIRSLSALAANGLLPMYDSENRLFCFRRKRTATGLIREGVSPRYTVIALMGLHRLEQTGVTSPIEIKPALEVLLADTRWVNNLGDLGLLLWLCALASPDRIDDLNHRLDLKSALHRFRDGKQGRTVELAWFLAGLSHQALVHPRKLIETRSIATETYRRIRENQSEHGLFGHARGIKGLTAVKGNEVGSFADQAYPIYALTTFSQAYGEERAIEKALDCGLALCEAQGSLGQWWWSYDSSNGHVVEHFPILSVHQHGIGPMALLALGEAVSSDFTPWIHRGIQWIEDNELNLEMHDGSTNVIWRSVERPGHWKYWKILSNLVGRRDAWESRRGLRPQFECRPSELGWLLYALAGQTSEFRWRAHLERANGSDTVRPN